MLVQGNLKLGPDIYAWSIPAVKTCPGASETCLALCYATKTNFVRANVKEAHWRNLEAAEDEKFVFWMTRAIQENHVRILRIHVAGDFYSREYIEKWNQIVEQSPAVTFFAYTRSWRMKAWSEPLQRLAAFDNMSFWLSTDRSMPRPPKWPRCKVAYLAVNDKDQPRYKADLVFREEHETVMKKTRNGSQVCPYENGIKTRTKVSCSTCKLCWQDGLVQIGETNAQMVCTA